MKYTDIDVAIRLLPDTYNDHSIEAFFEGIQQRFSNALQIHCAKSDVEEEDEEQARADEAIEDKTPKNVLHKAMLVAEEAAAVYAAVDKDQGKYNAKELEILNRRLDNAANALVLSYADIEHEETWSFIASKRKDRKRRIRDAEEILGPGLEHASPKVHPNWTAQGGH